MMRGASAIKTVVGRSRTSRSSTSSSRCLHLSGGPRATFIANDTRAPVLNISISSLQPLSTTPSRTSLRQQRHASTTSSDAAPLERTALHDLHIAHGAKMVPFAGYSMPVQYSDLSVGESHKWTREKASLFDVGHMVQHYLSGPLATSLLEKITPTSISTIKNKHSTLSCLLHPVTGGIVDDTVITRLGPELFYLVTNAACRAKDCEYIKSQIDSFLSESSSPSQSIDWRVLDGWGLIALQGPLSVDILQNSLAEPENIDLKTLYFGQCASVPLRLLSGEPSIPVLVSRGGYTGEDGFEISIPIDVVNQTVDVTDSLLQSAGKEKLRLAGLGARDSLRLEAGMCLYGHDLDDSTTPVEAGLSWVINKDRRVSGGFHGEETILPQLRPKKDGGSGVARRRVGLIVEGAPAREGAEILSEGSMGNNESEILGKVTSGCPSPTMGKNIAMGYVRSGWHKAGTEVGVMVRGKRRKATVTKMPFVESKYWKQAAGTAPG